MVMTEGTLAKIRAATAEMTRAQARRDRLVRAAREKGATWTEIGFALGMTAQGAQKRYGQSQERVEAYREAAAARAIKKARKAAQKGKEG